MAQKTISKKIKHIAENYIQYLKNDGLKINKAFIYGSYAKGNQRKWSDIDLCVVSDDFKDADPLTYLWSKKRKQDVKMIISPVGFCLKDFVNEDPLVWEIKKTGIRIEVN